MYVPLVCIADVLRSTSVPTGKQRKLFTSHSWPWHMQMPKFYENRPVLTQEDITVRVYTKREVWEHPVDRCRLRLLPISSYFWLVLVYIYWGVLSCVTEHVGIYLPMTAVCVWCWCWCWFSTGEESPAVAVYLDPACFAWSSSRSIRSLARKILLCK